MELCRLHKLWHYVDRGFLFFFKKSCSYRRWKGESCAGEWWEREMQLWLVEWKKCRHQRVETAGQCMCACLCTWTHLQRGPWTLISTWLQGHEHSCTHAPLSHIHMLHLQTPPVIASVHAPAWVCVCSLSVIKAHKSHTDKSLALWMFTGYACPDMSRPSTRDRPGVAGRKNQTKNGMQEYFSLHTCTLDFVFDVVEEFYRKYFTVNIIF